MRELPSNTPEQGSQEQLRIPGVTVTEGWKYQYLSVETPEQKIQVGPDAFVSTKIAYRIYQPNMFVSKGELLISYGEDFIDFEEEEWDVAADLNLPPLDAELVTESTENGEVTTLILNPNNNIERY